MNKLELANQVPIENLVGGKTGKNYQLTSFMYGCLDPRNNAPLSNVGVTGNSLSIDIWTGCPLQCAYCHVQGVREDLNPIDWKMRKVPVRRTTHTIEQILSKLIEHPLFEKDKTVLSICTSSTEPFVGQEVIESTLRIMEWFSNKNMRNPFWIVTKAGIPLNIVDRLKNIAKTNKIVISVCWADNNKAIEPYTKDRFDNLDALREVSGIIVNWYLRPLVKEWCNNFQYLDEMFKKVAGKYKNDIHSIVVGGLRWTEGIEYGLKEVRDLELPNNVNSASRHKKTLTDEEFEMIKHLSINYFGEDKPIYLHSSCMLSEILHVNNIAMTNCFNPNACSSSICTSEQRKICENAIRSINLSSINDFIKTKGFDIEIVDLCKERETGRIVLVTKPALKTFSPAISQKIVTLVAECMN